MYLTQTINCVELASSVHRFSIQFGQKWKSGYLKTAELLRYRLILNSITHFDMLISFSFSMP